MKYFEEIRSNYKKNLITSGRHYVDDGSGWLKKSSSQKLYRGQFYLFTDLFAFGKGNKLYTISLKNAVVLGPKRLKGQVSDQNVYVIDIKQGSDRLSVGFDTEEELMKMTDKILSLVESVIGPSRGIHGSVKLKNSWR